MGVTQARPLVVHECHIHSYTYAGCYAAGQAMWKQVLKDFWVPFEEAVSQTSGVRVTEVINVLDPLMGQHFFPLQVAG